MKKPHRLTENTRRELVEIALRIKGLKSRLDRLGLGGPSLSTLRAALSCAKRERQRVSELSAIRNPLSAIGRAA